MTWVKTLFISRGGITRYFDIGHNIAMIYCFSEISNAVGFLISRVFMIPSTSFSLTNINESLLLVLYKSFIIIMVGCLYIVGNYLLAISVLTVSRFSKTSQSNMFIESYINSKQSLKVLGISFGFAISFLWPACIVRAQLLFSLLKKYELNVFRKGVLNPWIQRFFTSFQFSLSVKVCNKIQISNTSKVFTSILNQ